ncbi:hypothetical protein [Nocardia nepalensis]|uniref:hypothetical protein n=1 Tax=Nocardia nepalensis TaxID=3375448 RepID=UPI003B6846D7
MGSVCGGDSFYDRAPGLHGGDLESDDLASVVGAAQGDGGGEVGIGSEFRGSPLRSGVSQTSAQSLSNFISSSTVEMDTSAPISRCDGSLDLLAVDHRPVGCW